MGFDLIHFLCAPKNPSLCDADMVKALTVYFSQHAMLMVHVWGYLGCSRSRMCSRVLNRDKQVLSDWGSGLRAHPLRPRWQTNWPCPLWQELFYSLKITHVETYPEAAFEHQSKICFILSLQNNTLPGEATVRVSKWGKNLPLLLYRKFSLGSWGNKEGRNQFPLFCFDATVHRSLEWEVSTRRKSLSIPVRVHCPRTSTYPKLHPAAGRPCLASSAGITNQRATETGPKRHASPVLI